MSEMIGRVSKAIAAKMAPGLIGERQVTVAEIARAAIEAMRTPTDAMAAATDGVVVGFSGEYGDHNEYCTTNVAKEVWDCMISAALQD